MLGVAQLAAELFDAESVKLVELFVVATIMWRRNRTTPFDWIIKSLLNLLRNNQVVAKPTPVIPPALLAPKITKVLVVLAD